jgi:hypothetical protein
MFVNRTRGVVWATAGVLSLVACSDPEQKTDLRPDGPPEVLSVLVMNDAVAGLYEGATFCKQGDDKRPDLVGTPDGNLLQICPDDTSMGVDELADANPQNWYVRIMFDELLDPSIEELNPILDSDGNDTGTVAGTIANTKPVKLECQSAMGGGLVEIPYDGYYSPSGNAVTWPLGPSLVIKANFPALVATQSECQVTINANVTDKDGNKVPDTQLGPYKFKIAPVALVAGDTAPADGDAVDAISAGVDVTFNTPIDTSTWTALGDPFGSYDASAAFAFTPDPGNDYATPESDTEFFVGGDFEVNGDYTFTIPEGTMITDQCGKVTTFGPPDVDATTQVEFTTNELAFNGIAPFDGQMNAKASSGIHLKFNQYMDPTTLASTEYSITPAVTGGVTVALDSFGTGDIVINGNFAPDTDYTFTLNANATLDDCPGGKRIAATCTTSAMGGTFTNDMGDQTVTFHTAPTALTATSPADGDEVDKSDATDPLDITLSFNTKMDRATLANTEWTIEPAVAMTVLTPATKSSSITLESTAAIPAGDYTFTLKQGATIDTASGATYTQAADVVIHFTVADPGPTPTPTQCY